MAKISYITFDQLMSSVESDLSNLTDNGMINRGNYIKVVRKVNESIGLKINKERETVLKVTNYKADLPDDFMNLQLAFICGEVKQYSLPGTIFGTHTEDREGCVALGCKTPDRVCLNECGGAFWVAQIYKERTINVNSLVPVRLTKRSLKFCSDDCLNYNFPNSGYEIDIDENQIVTNFREGDLYINYLSDMVDGEGNVLVLDHPMLTPYYEYSVKKHIFENLLVNGDAAVAQTWQMLKQEMKEAKFEAINFVNTPEYTEIQEFYQANRKRFYNKYHRMFYDYQY